MKTSYASCLSIHLKSFSFFHFSSDGKTLVIQVSRMTCRLGELLKKRLIELKVSIAFENFTIIATIHHTQVKTVSGTMNIQCFGILGSYASSCSSNTASHGPNTVVALTTQFSNWQLPRTQLRENMLRNILSCNPAFTFEKPKKPFTRSPIFIDVSNRYR